MNNKRNMTIAAVGIFILVLAIILAVIFGMKKNPNNGNSSQISSGSTTSGKSSSSTSSISSEASSGSSSTSTSIGDINGVPETSTPAPTTAIINPTPTVAADNTVYTQPKPDPITAGGTDGFISGKDYLRDVFNYDDFRYYNTLPSNYASTALNAKEYMREPIMFDKARNPLANDFQSSVTQTGQYTFQQVGTDCTNPMDAFFVKYQGNPVGWGQNVYTPWIVKNGDTWFIYYGGWGTVDCVGHDTTYLMTTKDPDLRGPYKQYGPVLTAGENYVHAQDASIAVGPDGKWVMAYTQTKITTQGVDWIGIATSDDGITWKANGNTKTGISDSPASEMKITNYTRKNSTSDGYDFMGRPSIHYNSALSRWEMYADSVNFDGATSNVGFIYLFTSSEAVPMNWKYEARITQGAETALAVINDTYYLAYRNDASWPTRMSVMSSQNGIDFSDPKIILTGERMRDGTIQNITQMAFAVENNKIKAVMYGRSLEGWSHRVSLAYPQKKIEVWRGNQILTTEAFAASSTTQLISSGGATSPLTKIRVYDTPGKPASLEAFFKLYSGQSVSLIKNITAPAKPVLYAPTQNETKVLWGTTFYFSSTQMASRYQIQVATDTDFNTIVVNRDNLLVEQYTLRDPLELGKTYYWRVIAKNSTGSNTSDVRSFTVLGQNEMIGEYIQVLPNNTVASDDADSNSNKLNLSDGPYYTHWTSTYDEEELPSFTMDYGRQYPISKVYWQPRTDYVGWPTQIKLEYSIDGKAFYNLTDKDCLTENNFTNFAADYNPKHVIFNKPINARFIRFTVLNTNFSPLAGIAEFRALILR